MVTRLLGVIPLLLMIDLEKLYKVRYLNICYLLIELLVFCTTVTEPDDALGSTSLVPGMISAYSPRQDLLSMSGQVSQLEDSVHVLVSEQHAATNVQTEKAATVQRHPLSEQLPSSSDIKLPPSMKSRSSSKSPDDDQEETITGIRYPPSWGQHRLMSPRGASRKISEDSDESFHSAESLRGNDYSILTSLDPPKTNIMVSCLIV